MTSYLALDCVIVIDEIAVTLVGHLLFIHVLIVLMQETNQYHILQHNKYY